MRKRKAAPVSVSSILKDVSTSLGKMEMYDFAVISGGWAALVGEAVAGVSNPVKLTRKTLFLEVAEPVWADSIGYMKKEIIEKVNRLLGKGAVSQIRMEIKKAAGNKPSREERSADISRIPQSAVREAEEAIKYIQDSQLRSAFKRIILKDIGHKYSLDEKKKKP